MSIRLRYLWGLLALAFVLAASGPASAEEVMPAPGGEQGWKSIPPEPGWKAASYRGWEVLSIPGLVATYYDLNQNGELDYMVVRKIVRKASAEEVSLEDSIEMARRDHYSVFISHPVIYFTERFPMFYCVGMDYRRNCQNMWVDVTEDGLNGNETRYSLSRPELNVR